MHLRNLAFVAVLGFAPAALAQNPSSVAADIGCDNVNVLQSLNAPVIGQTWQVGPDGVGIVEIEAVPPVGDWVLETDNPGWTGSGFYRWNGPNLFNSPGSGILTYNFVVDTPGRYAVRIHNRHNDPDPSEENDCWMSVNGSSWIKTFSNNGSNDNVWNWLLQFDPGFGAVTYTLQQGINEIRLSGRSRNFMIDRLAIWPIPGSPATDLSLPQSEGARSRPALGSTLDIFVDDPLNLFGNPPGASVTVFIGANAGPECGTPVAGFGLPGVGGPGEFLLDLGAPISTFVPPMPWNGNRIDLSIQMPLTPALLGQTLAAQGVFVAPGSPNPQASFTNRLRLTFGDY